MSRQLRPRKNQPSYASLAGLDSDEDKEEGPSNRRKGSLGNESDFEEIQTSAANAEDEDSEDTQRDEIDDDDAVMLPPSPKKARAEKGKGKVKAKSATKATGRLGRKPRTYTLPTPQGHQKHRANPIFTRPGQVERLLERPGLFSKPSITLANGISETPKIADRVSKAWCLNLGPGPIWELVEDRGWFKEAETEGDDCDMEAKRRPVVYGEVEVRSGWEILDEKNAAPYLPTDDVTAEDGTFKSPPPLPCYFGHIDSQERRELDMFEAFPMSQFSAENEAHVFNAGAPVWALDWVPIHPDRRADLHFKKYLAVAPYPSLSHSPDIGKKVLRPSSACIQIWSLSSSKPISKSPSKKKSQKTAESGQMKCEMVLCIDTGPAYNLKWCPLPTHDRGEVKRSTKLGLLGGIFEDGSFAVFVIPDPTYVKPSRHAASAPIYVRLPAPILRIELEETSCWSFDWANSSLIAIGTTNGVIAVYDISSALNFAADANHPIITDLLPIHYLSIHQSAVRAVAWVKAPPSDPSGRLRLDQNPTVVASGGYDGLECLTDIREGRGAAMNRTRDVISAISYSPYVGGPITMDHENTVKAYSASPSTLGRGHTLFEPQGPVWSVHASDYHPQLAITSADGSCSTTNMLRNTRRGGPVPFFVHKIFQMDYNRNTKEFRMLDQFLPKETSDRPTSTRAAKGKASVADRPVSSGAWPQQVGVLSVAWNNGNGLASSPLLASGTASGLCRIDVLWGRWIKDRVPYGGIESIRMEKAGGDAMDVDEDDEDDGGDGIVDAEGEDEDEESEGDE